MENRGPTLLVLNAVFMVLMLWSQGLRMWTRIGVVKSWGWDDSLMTAAVILYAIYLSFSMHGAVYGTGRHFADVSLEHYQIAMKSWWICYPFYAANMIASKLSIGCFLLRVSVKRWHILLLYANMAVTLMAGLAFFIGSFLQCQPISYWWTRYSNPGGGFCIDPTIIIALAYIYSVFAIVSDLTMALFPILLIASLNMNRRLKIMLMPLMAMGTIASLGLVVRLPWLLNLRDVDDFLWSTTGVAIWSTVESGLAIVAGNLATTRPLYRHLMQQLGYRQPGTAEPPSSGPAASGSGGYVKSKRSSRKNRSEGISSSGSFGFGMGSVFSGSNTDAYPLTDIDDGEYGRDGDDNCSTLDNNSLNINNINNTRPSSSHLGTGHPTNHVRSLSSTSRFDQTLHHHKPSKEVIKATTTITKIISDATENPRSLPRTDSQGLYHKGLPYGLRTQIVAGAGADRGDSPVDGGEKGPGRELSESQEELNPRKYAGSRPASFTRLVCAVTASGGAQTANGTQSATDQR